MTELIVEIYDNTTIRDLRQIVKDINGWGADVVADVDLYGCIYVSGLPPAQTQEIADFIKARMGGRINRIMCEGARI